MKKPDTNKNHKESMFSLDNVKTPFGQTLYSSGQDKIPPNL